jgi:hypothetical protein
VERAVQRVERVPGVGYVERLHVGDPAALRILGEPVVRHEAEHPPLVGDRELLDELGERHPARLERPDRVVVAGHRHRLHESVGVDGVDHRHLEPQDVDDALRGGVKDLLEVLHGVDGGDQVVQVPQRQHLTGRARQLRHARVLLPLHARAPA